MLYQTNLDTLTEYGINKLIQIIDVLDDCGHYDHEQYPWHAQMIDLHCDILNSKIGNLSLEQRVNLVIGISRIPVQPISDLINKYLVGITEAQFARYTLKFFMDDEICQRTAKNGPKFLTESDAPYEMLAHYLNKSSIPVTANNIRKEIGSISKAVIQSEKLPKDHLQLQLQFPITNVGITTLQLASATIERTMTLPSQTVNCETGKTNEYDWYRTNTEKINLNGGQLYITFEKQIIKDKVEWWVGIFVDKNEQTDEVDVKWTMKIVYEENEVSYKCRHHYSYNRCPYGTSSCTNRSTILIEENYSHTFDKSSSRGTKVENHLRTKLEQSSKITATITLQKWNATLMKMTPVI